MTNKVTSQFMFFGIVIACLLSAAPSWAGNHSKAAPHAAVEAPSADGRLRINAQDRCPLCGMFPAKRPKSAAALQLADGRAFYFCANGCLLRAWHRSSEYLGIPQDKIATMLVQDYFNGAPLDARKAWWVAGSDVIGPMGPALVTLASPDAVEVFKKRHGGRNVFQLGELDDQLWLELFPSEK